MASLNDMYQPKPADVPLGTGLASNAKRHLNARKQYQQWVLEDPENRSAISYEEWLEAVDD